MTKFHWSFACIVLTLCAGLAETSWGRGFGGMHGGGGFHGGGGMHGGGGFHGGMPRGGGMHPSGNFGGARPGGNFGGARPGGNFGGENFGGARPGGNFGGENFGGTRPGGSLGGANNFVGAGRPGELGRSFPGGDAHGFGEAAKRNEFAGGERPNRTQLNSFLGMPSDSGMHAVAGSHVGIDQRGLTRYPDADLRRHGDYVRRDFHHYDYYSANWYRRYPGAWYPRRYAYGNVWAAATWASMTGWFGYGNTAPDYYNYGNNVTYQDNSVYVNGQDVGTSDQYYQQAQTLASTGTKAQPTDDEQWMPLGVFAMTHGDQTNANLVLQLAVSKEGIIRGNYTFTTTNDTKPVQGSVDKKTQRAAWTIGDNTDNVMETGIYNLTKDEAPMLVHFGKDKTETWVLVRVKQDEQQGQPSSQE